MKNSVRFAQVLISLYLFVITFAMKLKDTKYKYHWNILVFCDQLKIMSDLNMSHGKCLILIHFHCLDYCSHKPRKFYFKSYWNTWIYFDKKRYSVRFEYVPWKISESF